MKVRGGVLLFMLLIAAIAVAGCGGGGSSSTTATPGKLGKPVPKSAFVERFDVLCLKAEKARGEIIEAATKKLAPGSKVSAAEQEVVIESALVPYRHLVGEFEELGAPKDESRQVEAIVDALASGVEAAQANPAVAISSDSQFEEFNRLAANFGLNACRI